MIPQAQSVAHTRDGGRPRQAPATLEVERTTSSCSPVKPNQGSTQTGRFRHTTARRQRDATGHLRATRGPPCLSPLHRRFFWTGFLRETIHNPPKSLRCFRRPPFGGPGTRPIYQEICIRLYAGKRNQAREREKPGGSPDNRFGRRPSPLFLNTSLPSILPVRLVVPARAECRRTRAMRGSNTSSYARRRGCPSFFRRRGRADDKSG